MKIKILTFWEYLLLDAEMHTGLSDHFMHAINEGEGAAFSLSENGQTISYAIISQEVSGIRLQYIFTHPKMRRQGYATKLIAHFLKKSKYRIIATINESIDYSEAIIACLTKLSFKAYNSGTTYTATTDDAMWEKMDRLKIVKIKELLLRENAECISFKKMSIDARNQLLNSTQSEFGNKLNPSPFLTSNANRTDTDLSTIMLEDGILCSYVIITRLSRDAVCFEQISETNKKIGTGSIIAPICCALEGIRKKPEIKKFTLYILDNNQPSADFFLSMFSIDELRITRNVSYTSY